MARRRATEVAAVTWRDGVHVTGTPIWCDARRRRDVCFVSSADRVGKTGHGQLIASSLTLALLGASGGGHLAVPLHRRFTLGTTRLELIASGRGPGATALYIDIAGKTVLYAGAIRAHGIEEAEVRACETVIVSAPYSQAAFPPLAQTIDNTVDWASRELSAGKRPVLLVDTPLDGLEVAMCLAAAGLPLAGARPIRDAAQRAGELAADAIAVAASRAARDAELRGASAARASDEAEALREPRTLHVTTPGKEPRAIVWLARERAGLSRITAPLSTAAVSADDFGEELHFPWASASGKAELLAWIESTTARDVFLTGACADEIAKTINARVLGPPHQMTLFEARP